RIYWIASKLAASGHAPNALFHTARRVTIRCSPGGDSHSPNERTVQQRGERTRIDHQPGRCSIDRTIDIQIETIADLNRNSAQPARVERGNVARNLGIRF